MRIWVYKIVVFFPLLLVGNAIAFSGVTPYKMTLVPGPYRTHAVLLDTGYCENLNPFLFTKVIGYCKGLDLNNFASKDFQPNSCPVETYSTRRNSRNFWPGKDKVDHFMMSAFLAGASYYILKEECRYSRNNSISMSAGGIAIVGIVKELYDLFSRKGTASLKDIGANLLGIGAGIFLIAG